MSWTRKKKMVNTEEVEGSVSNRVSFGPVERAAPERVEVVRGKEVLDKRRNDLPLNLTKAQIKQRLEQLGKLGV